ncbi:MAG: flagellar filament capping protein FliD [Aquabacterium sp.]
MSSTTSSTSGTISSLGVGSGLDSNTIVSKLVALERQPITDLQTAATKIQAKISAFGQIQSAVSTLHDAAQKLANPAIWSSTTSTSSDSNAVSFTTDTGAAVGNYTVSVTALATPQSVVTNTALASTTSTLGSGTLTFDLGTWSNGVFTGKTGASSVSVNIASTDTLEDIRDKINGSGAGVMASIVSDSSGARLAISSSTTGAANGFRITASDSDGNNADDAGLSALAYDPANGTTGTKPTRTASDAAATINGVNVTSSTNKFSNVLTGISFTVGKLTTTSSKDVPPVVTDSPVNVQVSQDNDTISKAINDFATSYSALATLLQNDTKYDDSTKTAGPLQADSTAVSIMNQFRALIGSSTPASSKYGTLSSIGVTIQTGGTLSVDSTKLTNALGNLSDVKKLFSNADLGNSANDGIATKLRTLTDDLMGFDGALTTRTAGLNQSVTDNQKQQDALDARATLYENRLKAQYSALDTTMASLNGTSSYVTQMITAMNKSS